MNWPWQHFLRREFNGRNSRNYHTWLLKEYENVLKAVSTLQTYMDLDWREKGKADDFQAGVYAAFTARLWEISKQLKKTKVE